MILLFIFTLLKYIISKKFRAQILSTEFYMCQKAYHSFQSKDLARIRRRIRNKIARAEAVCVFKKFTLIK